MNMPHLKIDENGKPEVVGDFEFKVSPTMYDGETFEPYRIVYFQYSPEMIQDMAGLYSEEEMFEILSNKIRNAFIKSISNI